MGKDTLWCEVIDRRSEIGPGGGSTLRHYLRTLWRRKWVALAPLVLIPLVTFVASHRQQALYEASADVLVNRQEVATTSLIGQTPALDDAGRTMDTQAQLARVPTVAVRTLAAAGLPGKPASALLNRSVVYPLADILRFTVDDPDPTLAPRLAAEYARQFVRYRRELDTAGLARTLEELELKIKGLESAGQASSPLYARLSDRQQQLESLEALRTSNISVVQTPGPGDTEQIAPRPLRNTALALVGGLVAGLILAFLSEALSTRPRSEEEIEALLGVPFLGRLRVGARPRGEASPSLLRDPGGPDADAFHTLRTNLELANSAVAARTIMVTSLQAGEGKSAAAANLAVAFARAGRHVVLVDLDLRKSSLTRLFGLDNRYGVTSVAPDGDEIAEALVPIRLEDLDERNTADTSNSGPGGLGALLEVVGSGPRPAHPTEFLSSNALAAVLADLKRRADIVLVDVPPLLEAPDAAALSARLDGLLLVVSSRRARRPTLADARRIIEPWPLAKLGFAIIESVDARPYVRPLHRAQRQFARRRLAEAEVK